MHIDLIYREKMLLRENGLNQLLETKLMYRDDAHFKPEAY